MKRKLKFWWSRLRSIAGGDAILCDSCKFNYRDVCRRPERPNARACADYKKK